MHLGEQLQGTNEIAADPALFSDIDVFALDRERIFSRPLMAIDHETRLSADGGYFCCEAAPRGLIVTRESGGRLHALRNICIHAGYPVCEAEEGGQERLVCPYHGWEYALDGRLVEPVFSSRIDPSRLRLTEYPVHIYNGLVLVDLSGKANGTEKGPEEVPTWLSMATVVRRTKYSTTWNWKLLRHFLRSSSHLFFDGPPERSVEFGPLSFMIAQAPRAFLLRIIPRFAEQTDFHVIEMAEENFLQKETCTADTDTVADGLGRADTSLRWFDRGFADWYWSLVAAA
jgi:nitrite reductase/ring-hydroxylating ferredoxin subunit